mmetsp:Transcript_12255/g.38705  ORF Transcript_12255/g.38705 Transcript_12255/m.38705 type:complete len:285 (+) Transcript_12255:1065-1919(+)
MSSTGSTGSRAPSLRRWPSSSTGCCRWCRGGAARWSRSRVAAGGGTASLTGQVKGSLPLCAASRSDPRGTAARIAAPRGAGRAAGWTAEPAPRRSACRAPRSTASTREARAEGAAPRSPAAAARPGRESPLESPRPWPRSRSGGRPTLSPRRREARSSQRSSRCRRPDSCRRRRSASSARSVTPWPPRAQLRKPAPARRTRPKSCTPHSPCKEGRRRLPAPPARRRSDRRCAGCPARPARELASPQPTTTATSRGSARPAARSASCLRPPSPRSQSGRCRPHRR